MLNKDALEVVKEQSLGSYSSLLLMGKVSEGWRSVMNLSPLNEFFQQTPSKMKIVILALDS